VVILEYTRDYNAIVRRAFGQHVLGEVIGPFPTTAPYLPPRSLLCMNPQSYVTRELPHNFIIAFPRGRTSPIAIPSAAMPGMYIIYEEEWRVEGVPLW
jgi:hypothetical protein